MIAKKDKNYFIPDNVVVGKFSARHRTQTLNKTQCEEYGFVTCRFKYGQWISPGIFERLTGGFKPTNQRDKAKQLMKAITDSVLEIDNTPVSGFKLISYGENPYRQVWSEYSYAGDVVLQDPRGFLVAVWHELFFETLGMSGNMLPGLELAGEYVYGWDIESCKMALIPVSFGKYAEWKSMSDSFKTEIKTVNSNAVKKKDLTPGSIYHGEKTVDGDWMYVGVYDTYSQECHIGAFDRNGAYDVDSDIAREADNMKQRYGTKWATTRGKMIFYSMTPRVQQYMIRSDITGIFSKSSGDFSKCRMHADESKPVTLENVLDDMKHSPAFNRIDFSTPEFKEVPAEWFKQELYKDNYGDNIADFPFYFRENAHILRNESGKYYKALIRYRYGTYGKSVPSCTLFEASGASIGVNRLCLLAEYDTPAELSAHFGKAMYPAYKLSSGAELSPNYAVVFVPKRIRDLASRIY